MKLPIEDKHPASGIAAVKSPVVAPEQFASVEKKITSGRARNEDGTWDHATLKNEHVALIKAGSLAPTRMLATRYGASVTMIKEVLAEIYKSSDPPILHSHDPFGRCKLVA